MISENKKAELQELLSKRVKSPNAFSIFDACNRINIFDGSSRSENPMVITYKLLEDINQIVPIWFIGYKNHYEINLVEDIPNE